MPEHALNSDLPPLPTSPEKLFKVLESLDIQYELHHHDAVFTVEESASIKETIPGTHCRNLYLRDKKKSNFLVVAANETAVDLKNLQEKIESGRLSFGSAERLWEFLGIRPGSVCPFTVINDPDHQVQIILDAFMMQCDRVCYHPLDNRMTIALTPEGLLKFLDYTGHTPIILDL